MEIRNAKIISVDQDPDGTLTYIVEAETVIPDPNYAEIAYAAYLTARSGLAYDNTPIPAWDAVKPEIQQAWQVAAKAVLEAYFLTRRSKEASIL